MMTTDTAIKIGLDTSGKKYPCPACGQRRFVRMKNFETGVMLPDQVGRCDRENSCGYHMTVKQYFESEGLTYKSTIETVKQADPVQPDFMDIENVERSMRGYNLTNFATWLISLFDPETANSALQRYFVGRSKNDEGRASLYWRIDFNGNLRTGKVMCYNPLTGKRKKDSGAYMVHPKENFNCVLPFFGEHLLKEFPNKTIGIVESEKTAIVASIFMPKLVWVATGGNSGCKWREWDVFKVLKGRDIILFPDFGYFNRKTGKTCFAEWSERAATIKKRMECKIKVSRVLEDMLNDIDREDDMDLADLLIKTESSGGIAVTGIPGYPVLWDLKKIA